MTFFSTSLMIFVTMISPRIFFVCCSFHSTCVCDSFFDKKKKKNFLCYSSSATKYTNIFPFKFFTNDIL